MKRQHSTPYVIKDREVHKLEKVGGQFDESWLQKFVFTHCPSIPIDEIEPAFAPLIPVCRELPTKVGPIDILFLNQAGLPTLVECKLWKNPEARREVIGQILDYAKEISQWSYENLQQAVNNAQESSKLPLYKLVFGDDEEVDESGFIDSVSRNLRRGRFLLLIIGDGIRENVEQIAEFLQKYAHLNFSFALVEFNIFKMPDQVDEYFVQPRLVTQTVEIERAVFRIDDDRIMAAHPEENKNISIRKRTKISEQVFFEDLKADKDTKAKLSAFLENIQNIGINIEPGQNSIKLKSDLQGINFGIFRTNGDFYLRGICSSTEQMGAPKIGEEYLSQLANLFEHGIVNRENPSRWWWTVQIKHRNKSRYPDVAEVMAVQEKLIALIQKTLGDISELDVG